MINSSVFNVLLLLLLLLDVFQLRTWKDLAEKENTKERKKQGGLCKDNPRWQTLSRTDLLLETESACSEVQGDESPYMASILSIAHNTFLIAIILLILSS